MFPQGADSADFSDSSLNGRLSLQLENVWIGWSLLGRVDILSFKAIQLKYSTENVLSGIHLRTATPLDSRLRGNDVLRIKNVNRA